MNEWTNKQSSYLAVSLDLLSIGVISTFVSTLNSLHNSSAILKLNYENIKTLSKIFQNKVSKKAWTTEYFHNKLFISIHFLIKKNNNKKMSKDLVSFEQTTTMSFINLVQAPDHFGLFRPGL